MNDDQKIETVKTWLANEAKKGGILAEAYVNLLKNTNPPVQRRYHLSLYDILNVSKSIVSAVRESES